MLFHQSAAQAMKKRVIVTHFTKKIIRTYMHVTYNKKILFVKKYFSLLWVFTDFLFFLNINTAITRQLIRTARKLETEWRQVCGEAWERGQRK
jgi:hypothetical protein